MKILVTGASGYLGNALIRKLIMNHCVIALVRDRDVRQNLEKIGVDVSVVNDYQAIEKVFKVKKPDIVINTVGLYGRKGESISELVDANITYPSHLLTLSSRYGVKLIIHTGTSLPSDISNYSLTKNVFSQIASRQVFDSLKIVDVALEHFYGPDDDPSKFISYLIQECGKGSAIDLTEGMQERDFIYIDDVTSAYSSIVDNYEKLSAYERISIGTGKTTSIRELAKMIHKLVNSESRLNFGAVALRNNELMYSSANTKRINELGWTSKFSLFEGLNDTINKAKGL